MAGTDRGTDREQEMRELLALRAAEGLTLRELSAASDVPVGTLSWWAAEIRRRDAAAASVPDFVELVVSGDAECASVVADARDHFEIVLAGGARVLAPARYGLARLVRDLGAC